MRAREVIAKIAAASNPDAALLEYSYGGLTSSQDQHGNSIYHGKVRDVVLQRETIRMVHTDRLTAFDRLIGMVPTKGIVLCAINDYWLRETADLMPNHFVSRPSPRELLCKRTEPVKIEMVVRGYLAGHLARIYADGVRSYCGIELPDGLREFRSLPTPIITPTTKAAVFEHDEPTTAKDLIAAGICSEREWHQLSDMALNLFAFGSRTLAAKGWILVDTKYEFGRLPDGTLCVIDEIHTPDSSRFWKIADFEDRLSRNEAPQMFDKEPVRRYLLKQGFSGHGEVPKVPVQELLNLALNYIHVAESMGIDV